MCYITNKIEHNGCGKIISGWDNFKTIAISIERTRISCVPTILFSLFSLMCELRACVWQWTVTPTNQRHLYPKLSSKANEIGREQRKKTMRFQNNNSYSKYLLVCSFVCIHLIRHRRMIQAIPKHFNGIFISTQIWHFISWYLYWLPLICLLFRLSLDYIIFGAHFWILSKYCNAKWQMATKCSA